VGKGTGQGLAIAHHVVVQKHQGTISLHSTVGQGSTFVVRIPLNAVVEVAGEAGEGAA
jgi:signal transduction histidine kinase